MYSLKPRWNAICVLLLLGVIGGTGCQKKPKRSAKRKVHDYINEIGAIHLGVVKSLQRYNVDKRAYAKDKEKLKQVRARLKRDVARYEKQYYGVSAPFESAKVYHKAFGEFLLTWFSFIDAFLVYDAVRAGMPSPSGESLEELNRRTIRASKVWNASINRMTSARQSLADKYGVLMEKK